MRQITTSAVRVLFLAALAVLAPTAHAIGLTGDDVFLDRTSSGIVIPLGANTVGSGIEFQHSLFSINVYDAGMDYTAKSISQFGDSSIILYGLNAGADIVGASMTLFGAQIMAGPTNLADRVSFTADSVTYNISGIRFNTSGGFTSAFQFASPSVPDSAGVTGILALAIGSLVFTRRRRS